MTASGVRLNELLVARAVWDPAKVCHLRGFPDELLGITVGTSPVSAHVVAGLKQHRTQRHVIDDPAGSHDLWRRTIGFEGP